MIVLEIALALLAMALLVPVFVLFVQVLAALPPVRPRPLPACPRPRLAVVMPAHNEALVIGDTVQALLPQLAPGDRLLVVADNCDDDTATLAEAAGAGVVSRHDPVRRGKGYALDFGVRSLADNPPEVVVIIDADCRLVTGALDRIAREAASGNGPVQALYLMHAPEGAGIRTRIAAFAWIVKNQVRATGFHRLGLPCQLMGTGMAFPWPLISAAPLASGHIVEDLKLGIDLARAGFPARFCPEATVTSTFPESAQGLQAQRTRWEHGHLGVALSEAPRLLAHALRQRNSALLALALDLCVPPLALLAMAVAGVLVASVFLYAADPGLALPVAAVAFLLFVSAVFIAWMRYGRKAVSLGELAYAPIYALRKIPLYLCFLVKRQAEWVRSHRGVS